LALLESALVKAACKNVGEIDPRRRRVSHYATTLNAYERSKVTHTSLIAMWPAKK